jgi:hypothetical protein
VGSFDYPPSLSDLYWDTTTNPLLPANQGMGSEPDYPGIVGRTTNQLKKKLPGGFASKVWARDPNINNGFPYLINNPPPQ